MRVLKTLEKNISSDGRVDGGGGVFSGGVGELDEESLDLSSSPGVVRRSGAWFVGKWGPRLS